MLRDAESADVRFGDREPLRCQRGEDDQRQPPNCYCPQGGAGPAAAPPPGAAFAAELVEFSPLSTTHPRVEYTVENVDEAVQHDIPDADDRDNALYRNDIALLDGVDHEGARVPAGRR